MIEVEVREQEMEAAGTARHELATEVADSGACVEHEHRAVVERELQARRVAAVADRFFARCRDRAAAAPDRRAHVRLQVPEDRDDSAELVDVGEEREDCGRDVTVDPVEPVIRKSS